MVTVPNPPVVETSPRSYPSLCCKAILAGTIAAIGIHILLTTMGIGAGLAIFSPTTDADPVAHLNAGAAIIWSLCALISLWFGALLAGRFSPSWHTGFVHGILVWSLTLIITVLFLLKGAGTIVGGGFKVLGEGMAIAAKAGTTGVMAAGQEAMTRNQDELGSFIDEATQSIPTNSLPKASIRAKREVGLAVVKLFAPGNEANMQDNRSATINALMAYTQMNAADATATVDGWIASYKELQSELAAAKSIAEQKARTAAADAAKTLSATAIWTFFGLLLGLLVSAFGGSCGAKFAARKLNTTQAP